MPIATNLSLRIGAIMLAGFVLLQLLIVGVLTLPGTSAMKQSYSLPDPVQLAAMVRAIEVTEERDRRPLIAAFNGSLYSVALAPQPPAPRGGQLSEGMVALGHAYRAVLPGHWLRMDARKGALAGIVGERAGPAGFLAQVRVTVALAGGGYLVVTGTPSEAMRSYLRRRSMLGLVGGLALMLMLALAVRQTTRPITRLARGVRAMPENLDAPDLPGEGSREIRALAEAFNDMKHRISGLVAERTRILAAIAHDMRTYLTRLRLRADFIADADQRARAVADLSEMSALLDDTLFFASSDRAAGQNVARIDLSAEILGLIEMRREAGDNVALAIAGEGPFTVEANPLSVARIFANLVDNGLRYGSRVELALARAGDMIVLAVGDDGPGVPAEMLDRLGEPYQRLDLSRDRESGGAGLGLAIVKALVRQAGGTIAFGIAPIGGLLVTVRLPAAAQPPE